MLEVVVEMEYLLGLCAERRSGSHVGESERFLRECMERTNGRD